MLQQAVIARQEPPMRIRANDPRMWVRRDGVMELVDCIGHRTYQATTTGSVLPPNFFEEIFLRLFLSLPDT